MNWPAVLTIQTLVTVLAAVVLYHGIRRKVKAVSSEARRSRDEISSAVERVRTDLSAQLQSLVERHVRIVVNTLPKVGSSSIVATLREAMPEARVDHLHAVSLEGQRDLARAIEQGECETTRRLQLEQFFRMIELRPELERARVDCSGDSPVHFVCGTREPIGWALSVLFQGHELGDLEGPAVEPEKARLSIMELLRHPSPPWLYGLGQDEWFHREITGYLGVNPMELGFDTARGFQVYDTRRGRLLVIRQENLDRMPEALAELLTAPRHLFQESRTNVTGQRATGSFYRDVASKLRFPASFLDELYARPYAATFYSPDERKAFAAKWSE